MADQAIRCPYCIEMVKPDVPTCGYCGNEIARPQRGIGGWRIIAGLLLLCAVLIALFGLMR